MCVCVWVWVWVWVWVYLSTCFHTIARGGYVKPRTGVLLVC